MDAASTIKQFAASLEIRARGDEPEITITTPAVDLQGDTIDPMGIDLSRYLNGTRAVFLAHDYKMLPVAKTLALDRSPQGIRARFRWNESSPDVVAVRGTFEEGLLGASVGLSVPKDGSTPNRQGGVHYRKSVLTEWSLTGIPANPECVRRLKALGLVEDPLTPEQASLVAALRRAIKTEVDDLLSRWQPTATPAPWPPPYWIPLSREEVAMVRLHARCRQRALDQLWQEDRLKVLPWNSIWIRNDWI